MTQRAAPQNRLVLKVDIEPKKEYLFTYNGKSFKFTNKDIYNQLDKKTLQPTFTDWREAISYAVVEPKRKKSPFNDEELDEICRLRGGKFYRYVQELS